MMNKSFSMNEDSPSDLDTTLERNISHVIDILENEDDDAGVDQNNESACKVLQGIRAYVEVRTNNDNRTEAVSRMLRSLGAETEKTFTNTVTHVIFKDGNKRTIDKAEKKGIHLVSVLWVDSCLRNKRHVSEHIYPAVLPEKSKSTPILFKKNRLKKMKSMQPNDFEEDVARSSERYKRKRRREEERLGLSGSSTPVASPVILAYDTVPRSPPSPSDWRSPIPLVIPATPASMKEHINRIRQARLNSSECSGPDSPVVGQTRDTPLHRKLFNGSESMATPSFNVTNVGEITESPKLDLNRVASPVLDIFKSFDQMMETHYLESIADQHRVASPVTDLLNNFDKNVKQKQTVKSTANSNGVASPGTDLLNNFDKNVKQKQVVESSANSNGVASPGTDLVVVGSSEIFKRRLFNIHDKNSPKPYLVKPTNHSATVRATLVDSEPRPAGSRKCTVMSKVKGQKRKSETDSDKKNKSLSKKQKRTKQTAAVLPGNKPVKNIYSEYISENDNCSQKERLARDGSSNTEGHTRISNDIAIANRGDNPETITRRKSTRLSSILSNSIISNSSLNESVKEVSKISSRRVSMATPDLSGSSNNSLRRSSRRLSVASFNSVSETESPCFSDNLFIGVRHTERIVQKDMSLDKQDKSLENETAGEKVVNLSLSNETAREKASPNTNVPISVSTNEKTQNNVRRSSRRSIVPSFDTTSDNPESSRNESNGCLGASMSAVFGDITMPSFSVIPSRRSIDDFKTFNRKKNTRTKVLSSISENEQKNSQTKSPKIKTVKSSKNKSSKQLDSENRCSSNLSYDIPPEESGTPVSGKVKLQRAKSFCLNQGTLDTMGKITRPSIVMTSMHSCEQEVVMAVIKKLGGFLLVDNVGDSTTHVVCGDVRRTLNVVNGVARGCWMLQKEWVLKSLDEGTWLDEDNYEVCDTYPQVKINRKERQLAGIHYHQVIFAGIGSLFISSNSSPPRDAIVSLIRLCGGEVTGSASHCNLFIGNEANKKKTSIKPVWILDSIMEHKLVDFNQPRYILNPNPVSRESSPEF